MRARAWVVQGAVRLLGGDREARQRAQSSAMAVSRRGSEKFRTRTCESGSESTGKRRGSTEWLTRRCSLSSFRGEAGRDDEETRKFRNGRDGEVLGGVDLLRPRAGLGVEEVEVEVEGDVPLAQPEDDHGVAAALSRPH